MACPWSHRTVIARRLKGLEHVIGNSYLKPFRDSRGWAFGEGPYRDRVNGFEFLAEAYDATDPDFEGRISVPVLWDKEQGVIVNNESADILRMLNSAFEPWARSETDLYPPDLHDEIDAINEWVYSDINNGVYRAGFASSQAAYDRAFRGVFRGLDRAERLLSERRYLTGNRITEADWRLWVTLVRFDRVYNVHFRCNGRRIVDYPALWGYARELFQRPGIEDTVAWEEILEHYYRTHDTLNPTRIIPAGPLDLDFQAPHGREALGP
jgi:putative glutathione S-transferase